METVFRRIATEVKSYLQLGDLLSMGLVCPFLSKLHRESSTGSFLSYYHRIIDMP